MRLERDLCEEVIVKRRVDLCKLLEAVQWPKSWHRAFYLSKTLVRIGLSGIRHRCVN